MALDGIMFEGAQVRIRRPADYNAAAAAPLGPSMPNPNLNLAAIGLDKQPVPMAANLMSQMVAPAAVPQNPVRPREGWAVGPAACAAGAAGHRLLATGGQQDRALKCACFALREPPGVRCAR